MNLASLRQNNQRAASTIGAVSSPSFGTRYDEDSSNSVSHTPTAPSATTYPSNPASTNMPSTTMPSFGQRNKANYGLNPANTNMPSNNMPSFGGQPNIGSNASSNNKALPNSNNISHPKTKASYGSNPANTNMPSNLMPSFAGRQQPASSPKPQASPSASVWKAYTKFSSSPQANVKFGADEAPVLPNTGPSAAGAMPLPKPPSSGGGGQVANLFAKACCL